MKKQFYLLSLFLLIGCFTIYSGCGSAPSLTKAFCNSEQVRIDAYYGGRTQGVSFSPAFYLICDSVYKAQSVSAQRQLIVYQTIARNRANDSVSTSPQFFIDLRKFIDDEFAVTLKN